MVIAANGEIGAEGAGVSNSKAVFASGTMEIPKGDAFFLVAICWAVYQQLDMLFVIPISTKSVDKSGGGSDHGAPVGGVLRRRRWKMR